MGSGGPVPRTSSAVLTPAPHILNLYDRWSTIYRAQENVESSATELVDSFNQWLTSQSSFREGVENWLREQFKSDDGIRVVIESDDPNVRKLPWQSWKLLERFNCSEVSVGDTRQESCSTASISKGNTIWVLAILEYDSDPSLADDLAAMAALPNLVVDCLIHPTIEQVEATLRNSRWDALYFSNCTNSYPKASFKRFQDAEPPFIRSVIPVWSIATGGKNWRVANWTFQS